MHQKVSVAYYFVPWGAAIFQGWQPTGKLAV
jgi:hypothetical protein